MAAISYQFKRSERSVFTEIYFPKRSAYYGAIYDALEEGYRAENVKDYLKKNASALREELREYPGLLDPRKYDADVLRIRRVSVKEAHDRIACYESAFQGWSTYSVDGVFFGKDDEMFEESTQIVRIMTRFHSSFQSTAEKAGCADVLRAILFWIISRRGRLDEAMVWSRAEQERFIAEHAPWPKKKLVYVEQHFAAIAKEAQKQVDDAALFLFGFLVKRFSEKVLARGKYEEEIWVTSFVTLQLNVVHRVER